GRLGQRRGELRGDDGRQPLHGDGQHADRRVRGRVHGDGDEGGGRALPGGDVDGGGDGAAGGRGPVDREDGPLHPRRRGVDAGGGERGPGRGDGRDGDRHAACERDGRDVDVHRRERRHVHAGDRQRQRE